MARAKGYLVVEGHGEVTAAPLLVNGLAQHLQLAVRFYGSVIRTKGVHDPTALLKAAALLRSKPDCGHALFIFDDEDGCPAKDGPAKAHELRSLGLPFPAAVVLAFREYETWLLPCVASMAGRPIQRDDGTRLRGLKPGTQPPPDPEAIRDAKGWLTEHYVERAYKETQDQAALTQLVDFGVLRASGLSSVGTLERALRFLDGANPSGVYPALQSAPSTGGSLGGPR
jgi:hypothetical protein